MHMAARWYTSTAQSLAAGGGHTQPHTVSNNGSQKPVLASLSTGLKWNKKNIDYIVFYEAKYIHF